MPVIIKKVRIIDPGASLDVVDDILISPECIEIAPRQVRNCLAIDGRKQLLVPGLIDLHVHFREPGSCYKEDILSGIKAALAGGVTSALVMPNTNPAIDNYARVYYQLMRARNTGFDLLVAGAASCSLAGIEQTDINQLAQAGVKAITDDGKPIIANIESVMRACRRNNLVCMQHAEDLRWPTEQARSEFELVERDILLAERIGARYHVLHLSARQSLKLVQQAKRRRAPITCEVAPHHLLLCDRDVFDSNQKMNPPLRTRQDCEALIDGLADGSIDAVASDHAPHHIREKRRPFAQAPCGVVGVESSILVLLTLVARKEISLPRAIALMSLGPARVLGEQDRIGSLMGDRMLKNAVLLDPSYQFTLTQRDLHGRSKNSAFLGCELFGRVRATFLNGSMVYRA